MWVKGKDMNLLPEQHEKEKIPTWWKNIKLNFSEGPIMGFFITIIMIFLYVVIIYGIGGGKRE